MRRPCRGLFAGYLPPAGEHLLHMRLGEALIDQHQHAAVLIAANHPACSLDHLAYAGVQVDVVETSAELAIVAHGDQHALSHAAEQWITSGGEHADHGDMGGHDHMHSNDSAGVIDVDGLLIENVRANLSLPSTTGSVWVKITNTTDVDEALIGAVIPGCGVIELHDMMMKGDVMVMQQVEGGEIAIPAGETVELQRGGLHIMCIQKEAPLEVGSAVDITLEFANAGEVEVTAPVVAPDDMGGMDHGEEEHDHDHGTGG